MAKKKKKPKSKKVKKIADLTAGAAAYGVGAGIIGSIHVPDDISRNVSSGMAVGSAAFPVAGAGFVLDELKDLEDFGTKKRRKRK